MKKVFFISVLALACMVCTTSCSDDDEKSGGATLTGITVTPSSYKGAVGAVQKITATPVPANATLGTLEWASNAAAVATVDKDGIVTITGVGAADVTVTSGTISAKASITGTIKGVAVADSEGRTAGTYMHADRDTTFTLTATIDPPVAGKIPAWSSDADNVVLEAAADGLTAEVTITGEGTAVITVTVDDATATYTISTTSLLVTATGYWTFDDVANLGKAVQGGDLVVNAELVTAVDGIVTGDGAVRGSLERKVDGDNGYGFDNVGLNLTWNHPMTGQFDDNKIRNFTMLLDVKVLHQDPSVPTGTPRNIWDPIYWNGQEDSPQAGLYIAWEDRGGTDIKIAANLTGTWDALLVDDSFDAATIAGNEPWIRFVFSFEYNEEEDPDNMTCRYYVNGQEAPTPFHAWNSLGIMEIVQGDPVYFMTKRKHDKEVKGQYDLSTLAVWDHVLTPVEIASLGGVSK